MIYHPSAYAKTGETQIGKRTNFRPATKAAAFLFQAIEELSILFRKDAGEELFCVCNAQ
jgi:hypothetical protein